MKGVAREGYGLNFANLQTAAKQFREDDDDDDDGERRRIKI